MRGRRNTAADFWSRVDRTRECWLWTGGTTPQGYGYTSLDGKTHAASHVAWILTYGPVPPGQHVLHNCPGRDNPTCVRPTHLWTGTPKDNMVDRSRKGRTHGAKLLLHQVLAIRALRSAGVKQAVVAAQFNVSRPAISMIENGHTYAHV